MSKFKDFLDGKWFVPVCIVLVAITAFCLGRVSGMGERREPVRVLDSRDKGEVKGASSSEASSSTGSGQAQPSPEAMAGAVVASKNGSKYHYPWCAGAKQISEKNKITFDSIEAARAAGYTPASNCKGLK